MNKKDNIFPEQDAPEKNTDNAFVQVGEDGSPVMPEGEGGNDETTNRETKHEPQKGTLKDR